MATALSVICPCAWALATPTVFAAGIGRSARLNILAHGGEPLELIREVKTVVLDKTETVTLGVLNPVLAAFLHHISSIFVVANGARLSIGLDRPREVAEFLLGRPDRPAREFPRVVSEEV